MPGAYITDGSRLAQVVRRADLGWLVEEGGAEVSDLSLVPDAELAGWRVVVPEPEDLTWIDRAASVPDLVKLCRG